MNNDRMTLTGTISFIGPITYVGDWEGCREPNMPPWPAGVIAIDGDLTKTVVILTYDGKVYRASRGKHGWPKEWSGVATQHAANPARRRWLARYTFDRLARQTRP